MVVRAPPGAFKSKWSGVPPRPAAPPPLPTNEKLEKGMSVALEGDAVVATFPEPSKPYKATDPVKWRLELNCKSWQRAIGVMTETPFAEFKIAGAADKARKGELTVRGATVSQEGKCSMWTAWVKVPPPLESLAIEAAASPQDDPPPSYPASPPASVSGASEASAASGTSVDGVSRAELMALLAAHSEQSIEREEKLMQRLEAAEERARVAEALLEVRAAHAAAEEEEGEAAEAPIINMGAEAAAIE